MAIICQGCGGVLGRDCFNESECIWITQSMAQDDYNRHYEKKRMEDEEKAYYKAMEEDYYAAMNKDYADYTLMPELIKSEIF